MSSKVTPARGGEGAVVLVAATCLLLLLLTLRALTDNPLPLVIALAFAFLILVLRRPIADVANGLWLRRSLLKSANYVRLEGPQDVEGQVAHVGLRTTTLRTPSGDQVRIRNTVLANSILTTFEAPADADQELVRERE